MDQDYGPSKMAAVRKEKINKVQTGPSSSRGYSHVGDIVMLVTILEFWRQN